MDLGIYQSLILHNILNQRFKSHSGGLFRHTSKTSSLLLQSLNPLFYAFFETVFLRKAQEVCSDY